MAGRKNKLEANRIAFARFRPLRAEKGEIFPFIYEL